MTERRWSLTDELARMGDFGERTRAWVARHSEPFGSIAAGLATMAWDVAEMLPLIQERAGAMGLVPTCSPEEWLSLYEDKDRILAGLMNVLSLATEGNLQGFDELLNFEEWAGQLLQNIRNASGRDTVGVGKLVQLLSDEQVAAVQEEMVRRLAQWQAEAEAKAAELIAEGEKEDVEDVTEDTMRVSPELHFMLKVMLPCWLITGKSAGSLLKRARKGGDHDKALLLMLGLDPIVRQDKTIAKILFDAAQTNPTRHAALMGASVKGLRGKMDGRMAKIRAGAIAQAFCGFAGLWLPAHDLGALFHEVAFDKGAKDGDPDFPGDTVTSRAFQAQLDKAREELPLPPLIHKLITARKVRIREPEMPAEN